VVEAELHQKKILSEISEDGVQRMKQMYDKNMKTKGTLTNIRGLKN